MQIKSHFFLFLRSHSFEYVIDTASFLSFCVCILTSDSFTTVSSINLRKWTKEISLVITHFNLIKVKEFDGLPDVNKSIKSHVNMINLNWVRIQVNDLYTIHSMDRGIRDRIFQLDLDQFVYFQIQERIVYRNRSMNSHWKLFRIWSTMGLHSLHYPQWITMKLIEHEWPLREKKNTFVKDWIHSKQTWFDLFWNSCFREKNWLMIIMFIGFVIWLDNDIQWTFQCRWKQFEINSTMCQSLFEIVFKFLVVFNWPCSRK